MAGPLGVEHDVERARWVQDALSDLDGSVASVVPPVFEAYARILHPATLATPTGATDAWGMPELYRREITWAEAAALIGDRPGEPQPWTGWLRRFGEVGRDLPDGSRLSEGHTVPDGGRIEEPHQGDIPVELLATLAELLLDAHGDREVLAAVWEGSGLDVSGTGVAMFWAPGDDHGAERERREAEAAHAAAVRASIDPEVTRAIERGSVLGLPREQQGRGHVLLRGQLTTFADTSWEREAGLGWREDWPHPGRTPNALWPAEPHAAPAWFVATEIDLDVTHVGGSARLIGRLLAHPRLEAERVRAHDPLV